MLIPNRYSAFLNDILQKQQNIPTNCISIKAIPVYDLPPLEYFIFDIRGSSLPGAELNPTQIIQNPLPVYHSRSEFPPDNL